MMEQIKQNWIDHYGFILVAFAHMTDWNLADSEIQIINDKIEYLISKVKQPYDMEEVARKMVSILNKYQSLSEDHEKMDALWDACKSLKEEIWFDNLSATVLVEFLAEIAEADHKIEETEIQFLKHIADYFGVKHPKI